MRGRNVVLDTNVLVMAISAHSRYHQIWLSFLRGDYVLCASNEMIEEYAEVLARNFSPKVSEGILNAILLRPNLRRCDPHYSFCLIHADVDDNKFVDCAIASNAEFIVTEDRHFSELALIPFPKVKVIGIDEFNGICRRQLN